MAAPKIFNPQATGAAVPTSLGIPAAVYPGAIATNAQLTVAVDRLQTALAVSLTSGGTTMTVKNGAGIVSDMLLSIGDELVQTQGGAGTDWTILRGRDGTTPAAHPANALVSGYIDAWHHNALVSEIKAIEQALGPNLSNVPGVMPFVVVTPYDFPPITIGGSIAAGLQTVTIAPVPRGVNGANIGQVLWLSGGSGGAAEAVPIVGGSAVGGQPSGTLFLQLANAHGGSWTVESASDGIQEAIIDAGAGKLVFVPAGPYNMRGQIVTPYDNQRIVGAGRDETVLTAANGSNLRRFFLTGARQNIMIERMGFVGNFVNQTYPSAVVCCAIDGSTSRYTRILSCKFAAFGNLNPPDAAYSQILSFYDASHVLIDGCYFESNFAMEANFNNCADVRITSNVLGSPVLSDSNARNAYWDNKSGGGGFRLIAINQCFCADNQMFGCHRSYNPSTDIVSNDGTFLGGYNSDTGQSIDSNYSNNYFNGLGNGIGTISVVQGSGTITGSLTQFHPLNVGTVLQVEGDTTFYKITARASSTSITVTPVMARATGSNLLYKAMYSGDAITVNNANRFAIKGNTALYSGDMGFDILANGAGQTSGQGVFTANHAEACTVAGLTITGAMEGMVIANNLFRNNCVGQVTGHKAAIDINQTNGPIWHACFDSNVFVDDQPVLTQLSAFVVNGDKTRIFGLSENNSHLWGFTAPMALYDSNTTAAEWAGMFNWTTTQGARKLFSITFARLGGLDSGFVAAGLMVYCSDAKSIADGVAAGSVAVGGGTGTIIVYLNGSWKVGA